jgi:hypothetical protein
LVKEQLSLAITVKVTLPPAVMEEIEENPENKTAQASHPRLFICHGAFELAAAGKPADT